MLDPSLAKEVNWEQIGLIMEHAQSKSKLRKISVGVGGKSSYNLQGMDEGCFFIGATFGFNVALHLLTPMPTSALSPAPVLK